MEEEETEEAEEEGEETEEAKTERQTPQNGTDDEAHFNDYLLIICHLNLFISFFHFPAVPPPQ